MENLISRWKQTVDNHHKKLRQLREESLSVERKTNELHSASVLVENKNHSNLGSIEGPSSIQIHQQNKRHRESGKNKDLEELFSEESSESEANTKPESALSRLPPPGKPRDQPQMMHRNLRIQGSSASTATLPQMRSKHNSLQRLALHTPESGEGSATSTQGFLGDYVAQVLAIFPTDKLKSRKSEKVRVVLEDLWRAMEADKKKALEEVENAKKEKGFAQQKQEAG